MTTQSIWPARSPARLFRLAAGLGLAAALTLASAGTLMAEEVNLYSSRHYDTDERLFSDFEEATGIKVNLIEDKATALIERVKAEGRNSPADILITVDAGNLWAAQQEGLFQPVQSDILEERIPANLRDPDGHWFSFSKRARIFFYDTERVDPALIATYEDLARPELEGMVCTRSSTNIYMVSLLGSLIEHLGTEEAEAWAQGVWNNRARDPEGGDTDQIRGVASGQCGVALANSYYFARAIRKDVSGLSAEDRARVGVLFPNQDGRGAHVNVSGGGVLKNAPNRENAIRFLEYLTSEQAQAYFSAGNDEYPVVEGAPLADSVAALGAFEEDTISLTVYGENQAEARRIYDRVGYE